MAALGSKLKELRKNKGITQQDLATILSVDRSSISMYESNRAIPPYDKMKALAEYFGVTVSYLNGETNDPRQANIPNPDLNASDSVNRVRNLVNDIKNPDNPITMFGHDITDPQRKIVSKYLEFTIELMRDLAQSEGK